MTSNQGSNNQSTNKQGTTDQGTTSITGSQVTSANSTTLPSGNAAIEGAMGITGSITTQTPDRDAGGPHGNTTGGTNPRT